MLSDSVAMLTVYSFLSTSKVIISNATIKQFLKSLAQFTVLVPLVSIATFVHAWHIASPFKYRYFVTT